VIEKIGANPIRKLYEMSVGESTGQETEATSFGTLLQETIKKLNDSQLEADAQVNSFLKGDTTDVHRVMIAMQKAEMTLNLAMQFRNKIIQAYEEVMRMQV
jgi:flagellar hook-basal body complex protein FliE